MENKKNQNPENTEVKASLHRIANDIVTIMTEDENTRDLCEALCHHDEQLLQDLKILVSFVDTLRDAIKAENVTTDVELQSGGWQQFPS